MMENRMARMGRRRAARSLASLAVAGLIAMVAVCSVLIGPPVKAAAASDPQITAPVDGDTVYRVDFTLEGAQVSGFDVSGTAEPGAKNVVLSFWRSIELYEAAKPCFQPEQDAECTQASADEDGKGEFRFDGQPVTVSKSGTWKSRINMTQWLKGAEAGKFDITLATVTNAKNGETRLGAPVRVVFDSTTTKEAADAASEPAPGRRAGMSVPVWVWLLAAFLALVAVALFSVLWLRRNRRLDAKRVDADVPLRRSTHREPPTY